MCERLLHCLVAIFTYFYKLYDENFFLVEMSGIEVHESGIFDQQREYSAVRRSQCIFNDENFFLVEMSGFEPAAPSRLA